MIRRMGFWVLTLFVGCRASVTTEAKMSQELSGQGQSPIANDEPPEKVAERDRPLSQEEAARAQADAQADLAESANFALFGARHDFTVKDASGAVSCQCVSVLLGPPSSGKLEWQGEMPRTKPETQLVVALIPGACPDADKGRAGASYWGYRVQGNDVIVLLEEWKTTRPRTLGAIIPKPAPGGQVYVAPVTTKLPYGKPSVGNGTRCGAGNPGPQRTTPLESSAPSESEAATDQP
jgi:hypothetical protein